MDASNMPKDKIVGSLGTDAAFDAPYLTNSLTVTDADRLAPKTFHARTAAEKIKAEFDDISKIADSNNISIFKAKEIIYGEFKQKPSK